MREHRKRRSFTPGLTVLEQRRLLALAALWIGQDGNDFTGTEGYINPQRPNDYQDIHLRLTGLSGAAVTRVQVGKYGGGAWTWDPKGRMNAVFRPDAGDPSAGDLFMEPQSADKAGTWYERIRVDYADGTAEETTLTTGSAVDPNLRMPGKQVEAVFEGLSDQDWTGPYVSVGPDGFKDVRISLSNLSAGANAHVTLTAATNPPRVWETGINPNGRWNAELLNRPGQNQTLGTTADLYFSTDVNLAGVPLTLKVSYEDWNPDYGSYTNRAGKTDTFVFMAGATAPNQAMPAVAESNLPQARATSLPQDASAPGYSHAVLDAASLAALWSPQSFASVQSAILGNRHGSSWVYTRPGASAPYTGGSSPLPLRYNATTGVFDFPPVRDEDGSTLTLLLTFNDGSQAVARFAGAPSDINRRVADTRVGASAQDVFGGVDLLIKLQAQTPNIHLKAGSYTFSQPLILNYPVRITADPGITLTFALSSASGSAWNTSSGAIQISSSHVSLDGFAIRFQGDSSMWTSAARVVINAATNVPNVDLSFTHLDVQAPAAATSGYEVAIDLMNFDWEDTGLIANNIFKGGSIQLGFGPWSVLDNDYQGAVANTITPSFLNVLTSHDLTIRGNHLHAVAPAGITRRFLVFGRSDLGQGIGNLIENNTIDGGIGTPAIDPTGLFPNSPEIILMETYQPRYEGKPSAVSPDGFIVQIPQLRGPSARTGDVVSIVTGPYAGQWRMIAQALGPTRYLLDDPLPPGDYVITIGRGFVDQTYRGNTIDLRGMSAGNAAFVLNGNNWGTRLLDNTFFGGNGLHIHAGSSQGAFESPNVQERAPWGWSRLPVFDLEIDGNTFDNAGISLAVDHGDQNKANSGRTYFTGAFSNNRIYWSNEARPAVTIGAAGVGSRPPFTQTNAPWITLDELRLTTLNNWGRNPATGAATTIKVYAATINGVETNDQTISLPTSPIVTAASRGQDGRDFVGSATGPDGYQDAHIVLTGLPADKLITQIIINGYGRGEWRYQGASSAYSVALVRDGTTADLFFQPDQNEIGRYLTIDIQYADQTWARAIVNAIFATALMPTSPNGANAPSAGTAQTGDDSTTPTAEIPPQETQVIALNSGGSSASGSYQADAHVAGGNVYTTSHAIDLGGVAAPAPEAVYQTERYGDFTYTIPGLTPGGSYTVRLHFSENYWTGAGQRLFNVAINGAQVLSQFDIFAAAGGMYKAVAREFTATADASGRIVVDFNGAGLPGGAKSNGVEILVPVVDLINYTNPPAQERYVRDDSPRPTAGSTYGLSSIGP